MLLFRGRFNGTRPVQQLDGNKKNKKQNMFEERGAIDRDNSRADAVEARWLEGSSR